MARRYDAKEKVDVERQRQPVIRVLELRSVRGTGGGPEKTILHGAALADPARLAVTVCYIRDVRDEQFALDALARRLGVHYVEVLERGSFDRSIWGRLRQLIRTHAIDIVHGHEYKTDLLALLLSKAEGVTALATAHGWTGHSPRERWIYYPADQWLLSRFPRVIAVSDEIRQRLIRAGSTPERVTTVLNGIDPDVFKQRPGVRVTAREALGTPDGATVIGSIGRLEPQKRFDLLMDAFARIRHARPDLRLLIAGDGSQRAELAGLVARFDLQSSCTLLGHRADVVELLHAFDLFVQSSDYEGTPNAVLEAMAMEVPVVATTAGGTAQLMEQGIHGLLVPTGQPALLADAIATALGDPAAAATRAAAARTRIEQDLSFGARMKRVEAIYEELAGARS